MLRPLLFGTKQLQLGSLASFQLFTTSNVVNSLTCKPKALVKGIMTPSFMTILILNKEAQGFILACHDIERCDLLEL